jgi:hypothetical protein
MAGRTRRGEGQYRAVTSGRGGADALAHAVHNAQRQAQQLDLATGGTGRLLHPLPS